MRRGAIGGGGSRQSGRGSRLREQGGGGVVCSAARPPRCRSLCGARCVLDRRDRPLRSRHGEPPICLPYVLQVAVPRAVHGRPRRCTPGARAASPSCSARDRRSAAGAASAGSAARRAGGRRQSRGRGRRRRPRRARRAGAPSLASAHSRLSVHSLPPGRTRSACASARPRARRRGARRRPRASRGRRAAAGAARGGSRHADRVEEREADARLGDGGAARRVVPRPLLRLEVGERERARLQRRRVRDPRRQRHQLLRRVAPALVAARQRRRPHEVDRDGVADGLAHRRRREQRAVVVAVQPLQPRQRRLERRPEALAVEGVELCAERQFAPVERARRAAAPRLPLVAKCRENIGKQREEARGCVNGTRRRAGAARRRAATRGKSSGPPSDRGPAGSPPACAATSSPPSRPSSPCGRSRPPRAAQTARARRRIGRTGTRNSLAKWRSAAR